MRLRQNGNAACTGARVEERSQDRGGRREERVSARDVSRTPLHVQAQVARIPITRCSSLMARRRPRPCPRPRRRRFELESISSPSMWSSLMPRRSSSAAWCRVICRLRRRSAAGRVVFGATSVPLDLAILLDTSASMSDKLKTAQQAAIGFVSTLREDDRVSIIDIKDATKVLFPMGDDLCANRRSSRRPHAAGRRYTAGRISLSKR